MQANYQAGKNGTSTVVMHDPCSLFLGLPPPRLSGLMNVYCITAAWHGGLRSETQQYSIYSKADLRSSDAILTANSNKQKIPLQAGD